MKGKPWSLKYSSSLFPLILQMYYSICIKVLKCIYIKVYLHWTGCLCWPIRWDQIITNWMVRFRMLQNFPIFNIFWGFFINSFPFVCKKTRKKVWGKSGENSENPKMEQPSFQLSNPIGLWNISRNDLKISINIIYYVIFEALIVESGRRRLV